MCVCVINIYITYNTYSLPVESLLLQVYPQNYHLKYKLDWGQLHILQGFYPVERIWPQKQHPHG